MNKDLKIMLLIISLALCFQIVQNTLIFSSIRELLKIAQELPKG